MPVFVRTNRGPYMQTSPVPQLDGEKLIIERDTEDIEIGFYYDDDEKSMEFRFKSHGIHGGENFEVVVPIHGLLGLINSLADHKTHRMFPWSKDDKRTIGEFVSSAFERRG